MSEDLWATVRAIRAAGATSLGAIAKALQDRGVRTPAGATTWHRAQVSRLLVDGESAPIDTADSIQAPPSPLVPIIITANHVPLPVESDDTVRPGWAGKERPELVNRGRWLRVPPDLAERLEYRRQALNLSGRIR